MVSQKAVFRVAIALLGILLGYLISTRAYEHFISTGVTPNLAAGYSLGIFALVLGAFGLIAVKVRL